MNIVLKLVFFLTLIAVFSSCRNSKPKKSLEDLRRAFDNESASAEQYAKFALAATKEGYDTLSQLFTAISKSEAIQASNLRQVMEHFGEEAGTAEIGGFVVKTTALNLQAAIKGETSKMQTIYPRFIRDAEDEKVPEIARSFTWAWNGGKKHFMYLRNAALVIAKGNQTSIPFNWLICPTCGNIYNPKDVTGQCDYCLTKQENFVGFRKTTE